MLLLNPFTFDFTTVDLRAILAALAIIVAVATAFYFQWWRNRKRLSYDILSDVELVSANKIRDKVEIRYEGQPVDTVQLLVVKLINDGYQPIKKDEFERPIRFTFPDVKVLTAEKEEFQPDNIATEIIYQENYVEITPALFNRRDYVQFKVLLNGDGKMKIDARVVGVSKISRARNLFEMQIIFLVIVTCICMLATVLAIRNDSRMFFVVCTLVSFGIAGLLFFEMRQLRSALRKNKS